MRQLEQWQLDGSAPELYQRYLVPAITALWATDLVARADPRPGEQVLDLACGTGVVARLAAERLGTGRVVGLDINDGMITLAQSLAPSAGPAIEWHVGSALDIPFPCGSFDLVLCQLGLQFFPNRPVALSQVWRVLRPGGRLALNVFSAIERNPAACAFIAALDRHVGRDASEIKRSEHMLGNSTELHGLVAAAGFTDVAIHTTTQTIHFPSPVEYVRLQLAATPIATLLREMLGAQLETLVHSLASQMIAVLPPNMLQEGLTFPQEAHVLLARK